MGLLVTIAAGLVAVIFAMLLARRQVTGKWPATSFAYLLSVAVGAEVLGTAVRVSGVLLSIPVIAFGAFVIWRSDWRLGDLGLASIVLGLGMALAYLIDASMHPNTGSQADQAAVLLVVVGLALSTAVLLTTLLFPSK